MLKLHVGIHLKCMRVCPNGWDILDAALACSTFLPCLLPLRGDRILVLFNELLIVNTSLQTCSPLILYVGTRIPRNPEQVDFGSV